MSCIFIWCTRATRIVPLARRRETTKRRCHFSSLSFAFTAPPPPLSPLPLVRGCSLRRLSPNGQDIPRKTVEAMSSDLFSHSLFFSSLRRRLRLSRSLLSLRPRFSIERTVVKRVSSLRKSTKSPSQRSHLVFAERVRSANAPSPLPSSSPFRPPPCPHSPTAFSPHCAFPHPLHLSQSPSNPPLVSESPRKFEWEW
jgi:hypothetical protein